MTAPDGPTEQPAAFKELAVYFALTFAITFGLGAGFIFFRPQFEALFGHIRSPITSWLYYVAVCAPTISAVFTSLVFGGWAGATKLFSGLIRRFQLRWLFAALLTIPAGCLIWALIEHIVLGRTSHTIDVRSILVSAPLLWFTTPDLFVDPGPWGEETGWRGFALPRLLSRLRPLPAATTLGAIWSVWHTPAFFVSGLTQFGTDFAWFLVGGTCLTVIMTWIYVNANRNYFVAGVIPHAVSNLLFSSHVYSAIKVEALMYIALAALVVVIFGPSLRGWGADRPLQA
jgi:membrane protease YdiL (CAAX protease family)